MSNQRTAARGATSVVAFAPDAMSKCPFYQVHMHLHSRPSDTGSEIKRHDPFPWCSHEHSTVTVRIATETEGEHKLKCSGDLAKCQVPEQWRPEKEA